MDSNWSGPIPRVDHVAREFCQPLCGVDSLLNRFESNLGLPLLTVPFPKQPGLSGVPFLQRSERSPCYTANMTASTGSNHVEKPRLSLDQLRGLTFIEAYANANKGMHTPIAMLVTRWGEDARKWYKDPLFVAAMKNRGLRPPVDKNVPDDLTEEQVAAVSLILNWNDKRSHNVKLKSLGIPAVKWQNWLRNPIFKEYLHALSTNTLDSALHTVQEGLLKATEKGDTNAIKYYMELTGRFSGDTQQDQNFKLIIQRIIETIQRHVKDQDTIRLIAQDFEIIMRGDSPDTNPVLLKGSI